MQYKCPCICCCGMPVYSMPEEVDRDENDEKLKGMYPELYNQVMPLIKYHCNVMEYRYGKEYCPSRDWVEKVCDDIMEKCHIKDDVSDISDVSYANDYRSPNGVIWWGARPLLEILLLNELLGRRRRRRERRRRGDYDWD